MRICFQCLGQFGLVISGTAPDNPAVIGFIENGKVLEGRQPAPVNGIISRMSQAGFGGQPGPAGIWA